MTPDNVVNPSGLGKAVLDTMVLSSQREKADEHAIVSGYTRGQMQGLRAVIFHEVRRRPMGNTWEAS